MIDINKIALRAINSSRRTSPSTYISLRLLLNRKHNLRWLKKYCERKLISISDWSYFEYQWFKKIDEDNKLNHRTFYIGSPTTLLVEAYILGILSKQEIFKNHSQNYSYYLAEEYSSYNYSYYYKGYKDRNNAIKEILQSDKDLRAYIFDLSNYYPSMDKSFVYENFCKKLEKTDIDEKIQKGILNFIKASLDVTESGIPVNPDIGHLLGSITLKPFDNDMYEVFENNYFRYVDDIVIIAHYSKVDFVKSILNEKIPQDKGANLNPDKYQVLDFEKWELLTNEIGHKDEFIELLDDIQLYLSRQDTASEIQKEFRNNKISIPIYKLYVNSRYSRWQSFIKWINFHFPVKEYISGLTVEKLLKKAISLKKLYIEDLKSLKQFESINNDLEKKISLKKYHYLINRLVYLYDAKELEKEVLPLVPQTNDFYETRAVINALIKNDVTEIIKIGGKSVLTFAEVSKSNSLSNPNVNKSHLDVQDINQMYSLGVLSLYGLIPLNKYLEFEQIQNDEIKNFLCFCDTKLYIQRHLADFSYYDEILSLRLNISHNEMKNKLFTKYDSKEKLFLSGLTLDEKDYHSL